MVKKEKNICIFFSRGGVSHLVGHSLLTHQKSKKKETHSKKKQKTTEIQREGEGAGCGESNPPRGLQEKSRIASGFLSLGDPLTKRRTPKTKTGEIGVGKNRLPVY